MAIQGQTNQASVGCGSPDTRAVKGKGVVSSGEGWLPQSPEDGGETPSQQDGRRLVTLLAQRQCSMGEESPHREWK